MSSTPIINLPVEIIERFLKELHVHDVRSMIEASPIFREISEGSKALWIKQATDLLKRWRPLSLPTSSDVLTDITIPELKNIVFHAADLERNWNNNPVPQLKIPIQEIDPRTYQGTVYYTKVDKVLSIGFDYILITTITGHLILWDSKANVCVGDVTFEGNSNREVDSCVADIGRVGDSSSVEVFCVTRPSRWTSDYVEPPIRFRNIYEGTGDVKIMQVTFSIGIPSLVVIKIRELASFTFPAVRTKIPTLLIPSRKLFAAVILNRETWELDIYVLHWDTGKFYFIKTNERMLGAFGHAMTYSLERDRIFLRTIRVNEETISTFSLRRENSHNSSECGIQNVHPFGCQEDHIWKYRGAPKVFQSTFKFPSGLGYPERNKCVHSMSMLLKLKGDWPNSTAINTAWDLVQYYSTEDGPYGKQRCVIHLFDPYPSLPDCDAILPLVDVKFRHAVWIEKTLWDTKKLMLATFPPPSMDQEQTVDEGEDLEAEVVSLDVPIGILEDVNTVVLAEIEGYILIVNKIGKAYMLRYA